jgi:hypothetical protein
LDLAYQLAGNNSDYYAHSFYSRSTRFHGDEFLSCAGQMFAPHRIADMATLSQPGIAAVLPYRRVDVFLRRNIYRCEIYLTTMNMRVSIVHKGFPAVAQARRGRVSSPTCPGHTVLVLYR